MVMDTRRIPEDLTLYTVTRRGVPINSDAEEAPGKDNLFKVKPIYPPSEKGKGHIVLLCNDKGKFRGIKPPGARKRSRPKPVSAPIPSTTASSPNGKGEAQLYAAAFLEPVRRAFKRKKKKKKKSPPVVPNGTTISTPATTKTDTATKSGPKKRRRVVVKRKSKAKAKEPTLDELVNLVRGE